MKLKHSILLPNVIELLIDGLNEDEIIAWMATNSDLLKHVSPDTYPLKMQQAIKSRDERNERRNWGIT